MNHGARLRAGRAPRRWRGTSCPSSRRSRASPRSGPRRRMECSVAERPRPTRTRPSAPRGGAGYSFRDGRRRRRAPRPAEVPRYDRQLPTHADNGGVLAAGAGTPLGSASGDHQPGRGADAGPIPLQVPARDAGRRGATGGACPADTLANLNLICAARWARHRTDDVRRRRDQAGDRPGVASWPRRSTTARAPRGRRPCLPAQGRRPGGGGRLLTWCSHELTLAVEIGELLLLDGAKSVGLAYP